jgi:hypothetical protein
MFRAWRDKRRREARDTSACAGGPDCVGPAPREGPGPALRALAGVFYLVPLVTFALCLMAILVSIISLVGSLFGG